MSIHSSPAYDFVVLGGGSAGYAAARTAHGLGLRTAVIDGAEELGGLCILRGCMPSKALIESSNRLRDIRDAAEFGLDVAEASASGPRILARKRRLIAEFASYRQDQLADGRFDLIRGRAAFVDAHTVEVTPRDGGAPFPVGFATACVATGSVHWMPELAGLDMVPYWTSDEALETEEIPRSVVVLGGGAIALEMACHFEGLGAKVHLIQRGAHVLSAMDGDVAEELQAAMQARGIEIHAGTKLERVERAASPKGGVVVHFTRNGEAREVEGERLLLALGRQPATRGLQAEGIGLALEKERLLADDRLATNLPHVFAAGDVTGPCEVVHTAIAQAEAAARNAARFLGRLDGDERIDYRLNLLGIFSDPEVAIVGLTEVDAAKEGRAVRAATYPFNDHGKSMIMGAQHGFVKMIADAGSGEIVGAAVVGPHAVDLIHEVVVAMHFRSTAAEFLRIPHYHPTLSEIWTYPAEELADAP